MMKFVYVLTSSNTDTYYEQFLISVSSLRLYNPDADIIALIDSKTKSNLIAQRAEYEKLVSEIKVISVPNEFNQKEASRWIKTSITNFVDGDFLYIDCDTVISAKLEKDFGEDVKIGAVLDTHVKLFEHHLKNNFEKEDAKLDFYSAKKLGIRYNGGLIYCDGSAEGIAFFEKWHSLWLLGRERGSSQDMPSLNEANLLLNNMITSLDGTWNCQVSHNGLPYLSDAKIIHYYATSLLSYVSPYLFATNDILLEIKKTGTVSESLAALLKNPKTAFVKHTKIIADNTVIELTESNLFMKLLWVKRKAPAIFKLMNGLSSLIKNPHPEKPKI